MVFKLIMKKLIRKFGHQLSYCIAVVDTGIVCWIFGIITLEQLFFMIAPITVFIILRPTFISWEEKYPPE